MLGGTSGTVRGGMVVASPPFAGRPRRTRAVPKFQVSAGLLMYRLVGGDPQVLLVHPGGPFFRNKDEGAWSVPKGEVEPGEDLLDAARREFEEEIGVVPTGPFVALTPVKQKGGKVVHVWSFEGDCNPGAISCNTFSVEWPPRSGRRREFPEIDRAGFYGLDEARQKVNAGQVPLIDELDRLVRGGA